MKFHFRCDTIYRAGWQTGVSLAVTSMQDRYFRSFSIPQLFRCYGSIFRVTISSTQFSPSARQKHLGNRETARLGNLSNDDGDGNENATKQ